MIDSETLQEGHLGIPWIITVVITITPGRGPERSLIACVCPSGTACFNLGRPESELVGLVGALCSKPREFDAGGAWVHLRFRSLARVYLPLLPILRT
eukprot:3124193-Rhodomonas_salina.3